MADSEEVTEVKSSSLQTPRVLSRLNELPIVNALCERVSDVYERTRERNSATELGFSAAEVTVKAVMVTSNLTYSKLPSSGFVGKLKEGFEERVSQVDTMACDGVGFLQNKWPIVKDETEKVMAIGAEKLEQSDLAEVLLTVTEAAVDYFKPPEEQLNKADNGDPPVVQTKVDRIRGVSNTIKDGGAEVVDEMLSAFLDLTHSHEFLFSPPNLGEGDSRDILGQKQKLRRSKRYKVKGDYHRIVDASDPFPVSPERKRKYDKEGEGSLIEELIHVNENYVSDEDPDYDPDKEEEEDSESSEDDEEENDEEEDDKEEDDKEENDEDGADEDEDQDESEAKITDGLEAKTQASSQEMTQSKQTVEVDGVENKENGEPTKPNISNKTDTKAAEIQQSSKAAEITSTKEKGKNESSKANHDADSTEKESAVNKGEGWIVI